MPSFDVVSKVDTQTLDNVINVVKKEIINRYDFRDSKTNVELDKKDMIVKILTETDLRLEAIEDVLRSRMIKQNLSPLAMDFGKAHYASGNMIRKDIKIKQGIDKESGKKIVKHIKDLKLKVEAQIMDDQVRVTGKKIDELQMVMNVLRQIELELPIQFLNFK
jgi:cyclic-di-GMP-binding protein